jgi:hypothetical protein
VLLVSRKCHTAAPIDCRADFPDSHGVQFRIQPMREPATRA